ncbi:PIN domain-containing protein [Marinobacter shengliensis]|uniref:hypothetical protein n=1 Tax=Marinobacter shengliensis TaxID=1389223 RepID=UPI0025731EF0|nr:hypothetical protein [Marinobacter shengliensis]BEH14964.1 ribonuclease VapC [Marinobacter shengliensis]
MILVDTSVWIDYFNGVTNPHTDLLDASIVQGYVAIGDLIFLEILQGIRNDKQYRQTKQSLMALDRDFIPFVDHLGLEPALRET